MRILSGPYAYATHAKKSPQRLYLQVLPLFRTVRESDLIVRHPQAWGPSGTSPHRCLPFHTRWPPPQPSAPSRSGPVALPLQGLPLLPKSLAAALTRTAVLRQLPRATADDGTCPCRSVRATGSDRGSAAECHSLGSRIIGFAHGPWSIRCRNPLSKTWHMQPTNVMSVFTALRRCAIAPFR
jgi:hypothetical protein